MKRFFLINKCNDLLRQKKELYFVEEVKEEAVTYAGEYENVEWLETMNSLDEKYRMIMILHYVHGFRAAEISSMLHIPASTVRTRLFERQKPDGVDLQYGSVKEGKRMRENEIIDNLQKDVVIPQVVQQKADQAFAQIKEESSLKKKKRYRNMTWRTVRIAAPLHESDTVGDITVTEQQSIVDRHFAHLSFKVEGYPLEEGKEPCFEDIILDIGQVDALLFIKPDLEVDSELTEDNLYVVPL